MRNSSYEGMVALRISNRGYVNAKGGKDYHPTVVLERGSNGHGHPASDQLAVLKDLLGADLPADTRVNPFSFNVIAFDVGKKLATKKQHLTLDHIRKVVDKLGDDLECWISVSWNSKGKPPKLNIAQASAPNPFGGGRASNPNPFGNGK